MSAHPPIPSRTWCIFRNLVHAVYRETRHLGPHGDPKAHVVVRAGRFLEPAKLCQSHRSELKSSRLHDQTAKASTPGEVLCPHQERTGLSIEDLIEVFRLPGWQRSYGGERWAEIAATLKELLTALEGGDDGRAAQVSEKVTGMRHNSGPLVPDRSNWEQTPYLREKWPELCE